MGNNGLIDQRTGFSQACCFSRKFRGPVQCPGRKFRGPVQCQVAAPCPQSSVKLKVKYTKG